MNKLKTIVLLTALIILLSCGGRQNERKMEVAKVKQERLGNKITSLWNGCTWIWNKCVSKLMINKGICDCADCKCACCS